MDDSRFNGSRSEGLAQQKFVREREIGIDVGKIRPQSYLRKMVQRLFSTQEPHPLDLLSGGEERAGILAIEE